ncbi:3-oxoadipate enol-lactonase [Rosenbergiella collisarenosi]|uniref:3-oxoadipate enol-lactonase n=1 Tax=Rosenbergiella collisarenosi TaxID=1544695 RepID=UPI001BD99297|nr:3-oxoadipate enol-lactonase [Rosenbergiella collisarenosi]MBT0720862.1 3-oxoadipate enol-lactonase [Rosenbergiella collisarenosi]
MDLDYRLDGPDNAPVLVLSNSLGTLWTLWDPQFSEWVKTFRVLRYHTRGHGSSPLTDAPLTLAQLGQDVVALLDHLNIARAHFCGISLGGLTGLWLNRYAASRFDRIVVANTAARIGQRDAWQTRALQVRKAGLSAIAASAASRWFTDAFIDRRPGIVEQFEDTLAQLQAEGYAACCDALALADLRSELESMSRAMLVIAGEQDPVTTVDDAQRIVHQTTNSELLTLPASHLSNVECGPEFTHAVSHFLTR